MDNKIEVSKTISAREKASKASKITKIIKPGIYNFVNKINIENTNWYMLEENTWIKEDDSLKTRENYKTDYECFIAPSDGTYYIKLKKNQKLYYEKRN